ncbi:MAG: hypothetical protein ACK5O7_06465 [Holosporales bacterium]
MAVQKILSFSQILSLALAMSAPQAKAVSHGIGEVEETSADSPSVLMNVMDTTPIEAFDEDHEDAAVASETNTHEGQGNPLSGAQTQDLTTKLEALSLSAFEGQTTHQEETADKRLEDLLAHLLENKFGLSAHKNQNQGAIPTLVGFETGNQPAQAR